MIDRLFPDTVYTATASVDGEAPALLPEEIPCVRDAVEKRRREFALGRACARRALEHFGIYRYALLVGPERAPLWPDGIVGSITHCHGFVGAAVARYGDIRGLGVDAESARPLDPNLVDMICLPQEIDWIRATPAPAYTDWPKVIFSAKEAVYKCLATWCDRPLDFHDVEIALPRARGRFAIRFPGKAPLARVGTARLEGRFAMSSAHVFAGVLLVR